MIGLSWPWGGIGEYAVVNDYNAVPISDDLTDEQSALIEPVAVVVHAAERAGVRPGSSVLVTGAGPIGQLQVMAARAAGASRIFLSDTNDNRLELARKISQDVITLNPKRDHVGDAVRDQTEAGIGADAVIECWAPSRRWPPASTRSASRASWSSSACMSARPRSTRSC